MTNPLKATRRSDFSEWYQQVIKASDIAETAAVRGCMNIKPWGYSIWENIQSRFDKILKATGHRNAYFPLLIPLRFFQREAEHVEGFAKECAIVTHHRLQSEDGLLSPDPASELEEPLIIRPTSETIIGDAFSRWIQSPKDLPLLINQWCNVMRWEMRPRLFLRTSEFLWQEGHTAHATEAEAVSEARTILNLYRDFVSNVLGIPVIVGEKSPAERFPGAVNTWSIEAMMQDGKALQAGTSHFLGQNFSRAYGIRYDSEAGDRFVWTTSWGISTRLIGGLVMTHSDDIGLVLPPAIAPVHVRALLLTDSPEEEKEYANYLNSLLQAAAAPLVCGEPLRVELVRAGRRPGDAFWNAIRQGVPVVVQIGSREVQNRTVSFTVRSDPTLSRQTVSGDFLLGTLVSTLEEMQRQLLLQATALRNSHIVRPSSLTEFRTAFSNSECSQFAIVPIDINAEKDEVVQSVLRDLKLTVRCLPESGADLEIEPTTGSTSCLFTRSSATHNAVIARSY